MYIQRARYLGVHLSNIHALSGSSQAHIHVSVNDGDVCISFRCTEYIHVTMAMGSIISTHTNMHTLTLHTVHTHPQPPPNDSTSSLAYYLHRLKQMLVCAMLQHVRQYYLYTCSFIPASVL